MGSEGTQAGFARIPKGLVHPLIKNQQPIAD